MVRQDIVAILRNALERGESIQQARKSLVNSGYNFQEVEEAIRYLNRSKLPKAPHARTKFIPELPRAGMRHSPKKFPFWIIIVIAVVILLYFFVFSGTVSSSDCGSNVNCFLNNAENCKASKLSFSGSEDFFGMVITSSIDYEVLAGCDFAYTVKEFSLRYNSTIREQLMTSGVTREEIDQLEQETNVEMDKLEGKRISCSVESSEDLYYVLNKLLVEGESQVTASLVPQNDSNAIAPFTLHGRAECREG
ncbi:MAG: hypothetical protein JSW08_00775 [archaeon]|nr:MAG: hypothetical protein JSW08_00775 [archaeon]